MTKRGKKAKIIQKKKGKSLDKVLNLAIIAAAFLCSFIYLSGNITGNMILESSVKTSNIFGSLLFIVGVVATFIYTKRK